MNWTEDLEAVRLASVGLARRALRVAPDDPDVLALAAFTFGYFGEDIGVAIGLIDRCLALNRAMLALGTGVGCSGSLPVSLNARSMISKIICGLARVTGWPLI